MILELPTKGEAHFFVNMVANAVEDAKTSEKIKEAGLDSEGRQSVVVAQIITADDFQGISPFQIACEKGNADLVEYLLLQCGEEDVGGWFRKIALTETSGEGNQWCSIHFAALSGHVGTLKVLLNAAANLDIEQALINQRDFEGKSALHLAIEQNCYGASLFLIRPQLGSVLGPMGNKRRSSRPIEGIAFDSLDDDGHTALDYVDERFDPDQFGLCLASLPLVIFKVVPVHMFIFLAVRVFQLASSSWPRL